MKKILSLMLIMALFVTADFGAFASETTDLKSGQIISEITSEISPENIELQEEALKYIEQLAPFVVYENGSAKLTTEDLDVLGITEQQLKEFKTGLNIDVECTVGASIKTNSSINKKDMFSVQPGPGSGVVSNKFVVKLSATDVRNIAVGMILAGAALGIASFFIPAGAVGIFCGLLFYKATMAGTFGIIIGTAGAILPMYAPNGVSFEVPVSDLYNAFGWSTWYGTDTLGNRLVKSAYFN
jgi:hypothetical protein